MGGRLLRRWMHRPLRDHALLQARHQCIAALLDANMHDDLHTLLRGITDIERILTRIALKSARPRDLTGLRDSLGQLPAIQEKLATTRTLCWPPCPAASVSTPRSMNC